jgi:hypothetical protein
MAYGLISGISPKANVPAFYRYTKVLTKIPKWKEALGHRTHISGKGPFYNGKKCFRMAL